jgi:hypothetical protein
MENQDSSWRWNRITPRHVIGLYNETHLGVFSSSVSNDPGDWRRKYPSTQDGVFRSGHPSTQDGVFRSGVRVRRPTVWWPFHGGDDPVITRWRSPRGHPLSTRCSTSTTNPVCERRVNLLVCSLQLHRHSYIGFILAFTSSIHNKQPWRSWGKTPSQVTKREILVQKITDLIISLKSHTKITLR